MQIETERLRLRPIPRDEALAFHEGRVPAGVRVLDGYPTAMAREVMDIFVGSRQDDAIGFRPWFMVRRSDGCVIGEIGCGVSEDGTSASVGYSVVPLAEGQGYASEALKRLVTFLFETEGVERVEANTFPGHIASRRVMENAGMTLAGEGEALHHGEPLHVVFYEVRRP